MNSDIEFLDQKRMTFLKWYLIGFGISMLLVTAQPKPSLSIVIAQL
jgi:hypothetical protein